MSARVSVQVVYKYTVVRTTLNVLVEGGSVWYFGGWNRHYCRIAADEYRVGKSVVQETAKEFNGSVCLIY